MPESSRETEQATDAIPHMPAYLATGVQEAPATQAIPAAVPNYMATSVQEKPPTMEVGANPANIMATSAGVPTQTVLARATKLVVPGYELLESIGKGGMGIVYRARQIALDRDIALKFLREDINPKSSTGLRFLEEAKITAQLQHPGIPAVHEVGTLPDGRPYLAMKLIRGNTLNDRLKEQGPGSTKWLSVFEAICQAVGFAHTHGVIHRDLKPLNVMVGAFGEVQVMDWGLAKVIGRTVDLSSDEESEAIDDGESISRSEGSVETRAGSYLGTPAFMAPEQAVGAIEQLSPRTDVFGLGAVLCMLLTGKPPYLGMTSETTRLMAAAVKQEEAFERLEACGADPDLIDLCKRCLSGEPSARPADGAVVARQVASLRSYAEERAKQAELDIARTEVAAAEERKRRKVQRKLGAAIAAVLVVGTVAATIGFVRANRAKELAVANEQKATANEQKAIEEKRVSDSTLHFFLDDLLKQADSDKQGAGLKGSADPTIRELLDRAALELRPEKIEKKFPGQPVVQAKILSAVGGTYGGLQLYGPAISHLKRAVTQLEQTLGPKNKETLDARSKLALTYRDADQLAEAIVLLEQVRDLNLEIYANELNHGNLLNSISNLAQAYEKLGKAKDAIKLLEGVREDFINKGPEFDEQRWNNDDSLAGAYLSVDRTQAAISLYQEVLEGRRRVLGESHGKTLLTLNNLAGAYLKKGEPADIEECVRIARQAIPAMTAAKGDNHPYTLVAMYQLVNANLTMVRKDLESGKPVQKTDPRLVESVTLLEQINDRAVRTGKKEIVIPAAFAPDHPQRIIYEDRLAEVYATVGQPEKAIPLFEIIFERLKKAKGLEDPKTLQTLNNLGDSYYKAGQAAKDAGDQTEAMRLASKAVAIFKQIREVDTKDPKKGSDHQDTIKSTRNLANALQLAGRNDEAIVAFEDAAKAAVRIKYQCENCHNLFRDLAKIYEALGRYEDAEPWWKNMIICVKQDYGMESFDYYSGLANFGKNQIQQEKWPTAVAVLKESVAGREKLQPGTWQLFNTQSMLGEALMKNNQLAEAGPMLERGYQGLLDTAKTLPPDVSSFPTIAGQRLLKYYEATKDDRAKELKAKLK